MQFNPLSSASGLLTMNVAIASIALGIGALITGWLVRRSALPLRHGLLCAALLLMVTAPVPVWIGSEYGFGLLSVPLGTPRVQRTQSESSAPADSSIDTARLATRPNTPPVSSAPLASSRPATPFLDEPNTPSALPKSDSTASASRETWSPSLLHRFENLSLQRFVDYAGTLLGGLWVVGALWFSVRLVRELLIVRRLRMSLQPATASRLVLAGQRATSMAGRAPGEGVFVSRLAPAPLTLGWWRPKVVMPEGLVNSLDDDQLVCVLAHETAHAARQDTVAAFLQRLAGIGFWWNPLLHTINRQINRLRERICDDHVVRQFGDGLPLAEAIVRVAEWSADRELQPSLAVTLLDESQDIEQRIVRLADRNRMVSVSLNAQSAACIGLFALVLAAVPFVPALRAQQPEPEARPVVLQPVASEPAGWQILIRVVDDEGRPIPNPEIGVRLPEVGTQWFAGDRDGRFTATVPSPTPRYCTLRARAGGYAPMRAAWSNRDEQVADPLPAEFTFEMTSAITVGGVVLDENDLPIADATVLFSAGDRERNRARRAYSSMHDEECITDADGKWRCDVAPETLTGATLKITHSDYALDTSRYSQDHRISELRDLTHSWMLRKGFAITGWVVDVEGNPVAGAALAIGELNAYDDKSFQHTDADGRYRFERVSPHHEVNDDQPIRFTVSVLKPGYAPVMELVPGYGKRPMADSTPGERIVDFTLERGVTLTLHVVDSQNRPIPGAIVSVDEWNDTDALRALRRFGIPRKADERGVWEWTDVPPGDSISYDIFKRGYADVRDHSISVEAETHGEVIVLNQPQVVTGTVINAITKQPIQDFVVERAFENVGGHVDGLYWASDGTRGKGGNYRKRVTMPPRRGTYTYRVLAHGYKTALKKSVPFVEGETTLNFELQPLDGNADQTNAEQDEESPRSVAPPGRSSWRSFRNGNGQMGVAGSALPQKLQLLWKFPLEYGVAGAAAIVGDDVYVGGLDGWLYCLDRRMGQVVWKYRAIDDTDPNAYAPGFGSSPHVTADSVYIGDENGVMHAVDRVTGKRRWKFETGAEIPGGAAVVGQLVLFGSHDGSVYCLHANSGAVSWEFQTSDRVNCSLAIASAHTFVAGCDGYLRVIAIEDGRQVGELNLGSPLIASPALLENHLYVGTHDGEFQAIDWTRPAIDWTHANRSRAQEYRGSAAITEKYVIVGSRDKRLHCLNRATGEAVWSFPTRAAVDSSPAVVDGRVFFGSNDGNIYGVGLHDGKQLWKFNTGGDVTGSPAIGEGCLIIGSEASHAFVYCFGAKD